MIEKIGSITLDDTCYPGEDLYCDGEIEDKILEIVKTHGPAEYGKIIEEEKSWPILYHLSHLRGNIVDWIPVKKTDKVLEVGSGCGGVTGTLAAKAGEVTCIELSRKRSLINAYRHPGCDNVTIKLGNFQDVEPALDSDYDYIFLIGVFEYAGSYIGGEAPFETFMAILKRHLAPGGRLVIAIENRFGLKYWAGCREDHSGVYFDGIEGYLKGGGARTFTRKGLEGICRANGVTDFHFYYPYPDYKFMTAVYSDERLPKTGELCDNIRNFDRDRLLLFDEKNVFDSLIREGMFPQFSNSYLLVIGKELPVLYAKFSNDRAPEYAVRTEIRRKVGGCPAKDGGAGGLRRPEPEGGSLEVRKIPLGGAAQAHVDRLASTYRALENAYAGSGFAINRCVMDGGEAVFEYLQGQTLEELLDHCLEKGDRDGFLRLFERFRDVAAYPREPSVYNYDLIFSNIIVTGETWNLIDYEWASKQRIPVDDLILRALYCYGLGSARRKEVCLSLIREVPGWEGTEVWNEASLEKIVRREIIFQKHSTGNRMSMVEMRNAIGRRAVPVVSLAWECAERELRNRIQIYEDYGGGFSEAGSYFLERSYREGEAMAVEIQGTPGLQALRLDPALDCCIVRIRSLRLWGEELTLQDADIKLNGKLISNHTVIFAAPDPNISILNIEEKKKELFGQRLAEGGETDAPAVCLRAELEVTHLSRETAEAVAAGGTDGKQEKQEKRKGLSWFRK